MYKNENIKLLFNLNVTKYLHIFIMVRSNILKKDLIEL